MCYKVKSPACGEGLEISPSLYPVPYRTLPRRL
nr:MAG TPA: hypothetical protein [Inoviridae sp.]